MKSSARSLTVLTVLMAMLLTAQVSRAADDKMTQTVQALQKRLAELEAARKADQARIAKLEAKLDDKAMAKARAEDIKAVLKEMHLDARRHQLKGFGVWSNLDIQIYGYVKLDASWDSGRANNGNFARWVAHEGANKRDDQFNMTARQTRLGMKITGPEDQNVKTRGVIEIDFYGTGGETSPHPRMRHAYLVIEWPKHNFSILAGQTSDVISPLVPNTLNYTVAWWAGNIGFRHPQIRATKVFKFDKDTSVKLQLAVSRTIGRVTGFDPGDSGEDAGYPTFQGRASVTFPGLANKKTTIGISGHFGKEEYDTGANGRHTDLYSWSANADIHVPINNWLAVKGEIFTGQNLDGYLGGIGQGVNVTALTVQEVNACGGWLAIALNPWKKWQFNFGASVDAVQSGDVTAADARMLNRAMWGNVIYSVNKATSVGFEISHWHTDYKDRAAGDALRLQTSFIYKF